MSGYDFLMFGNQLINKRYIVRIRLNKNNVLLTDIKSNNISETIAETYDSIKDAEKRLKELSLILSDRELMFKKNKPIDLSNSVVNPVANPVVNPVANPVANTMANPVANLVANTMANPVANTMANPVVNPVATNLLTPSTIIRGSYINQQSSTLVDSLVKF
jgi:hypothetical protein